MLLGAFVCRGVAKGSCRLQNVSTTEILHRPERPHTTNASDAEKLTHSAAHATFTIAGSPCIPRVGTSTVVLLQARQGAAGNSNLCL